MEFQRNPLAILYYLVFGNQKIKQDLNFLKTINVCFFAAQNYPQTLKGVFSLNTLKDLKTIDIKKINGLSHSLYGIFDFIDENTLKISKFSPSLKTRSISFEKNNYLILCRKQIHGST